jgi:hypothetical protein
MRIVGPVMLKTSRLLPAVAATALCLVFAEFPL